MDLSSLPRKRAVYCESSSAGNNAGILSDKPVSIFWVDPVKFFIFSFVVSLFEKTLFTYIESQNLKKQLHKNKSFSANFLDFIT